MRNLVYYVAVSIDGYIADPSGGFDAFPINGDHMEAVCGEYADALPAHVHAALGIEPPRTHFDTVVMGWNTLTPALTAGISSPYPHLRQYVASRRARHVDESISLTADPVTTVRALKRETGLGIWLCGGGQLAGTLLPEIDRLILKRNPVVFGAGIPLFGNASQFGHASHTARPFTLVATRRFSSGVIMEEYRTQTR